MQVSWVLCPESRVAEIKVLAGLLSPQELELKVLFQGRVDVGGVELFPGCR